MNQNSIRVGIAPINWSNDDLRELGGDISLEQCLAEMQAAGYTGTELGHKFPTVPERLKPLLGRYGLTLASSWHSIHFAREVSLDDELAHLENRLKFLSAMGTTVINLAECSGTVHNVQDQPLSARPVFTDREWDRVIKGMNLAGELCLSYRIHAAVHHHMGTGIQTGEEIDRLLSGTDPDKVFLCADTGHLQFAGEDPRTLVKKHQNRIAHIHLKDLRQTALRRVWQEDSSFLAAVLAGVFTVPGDGMINFAPILDLVAQGSYEGWLVVEAEQDPSRANPLNYARLARTYLSTVANV
ncbi:MAG: myo-inosose-2 dehydratase [Candidatus Neomarinimicrobiota bacterium]